MEADSWQSCTKIFTEAVELTGTERAAFLEAQCAGDAALRRKVEILLKADEHVGGFIDKPALETAPELFLDDPNALLGEQLGHYRIESILGVGGMGVVYLAHDERLGRKVGLKLLPQTLVSDVAQLERLKQEARTASALNHPNIVTIHDIGEVEGVHYIAAELIEGVTLRERIAQGLINPDEALPIAIQIASALSVAHAAGIVHRDIKPENVMLRPDGYVKVLDFGIAKFTQPDSLAIGHLETRTQPGVILGTTRYMSPEQARGLPADARSDIWSLGVVLYEMLGGIQPFLGETPSDCIASILQTEPPPLSSVLQDVPAELERIIQKALRKNADERYQTVADMVIGLRELQRQGFAPPSGTRDEAIFSKLKQHKRAALLVAAAVVLIAVAFAYSFYFATPPAPLPNEKSIAVLPLVNSTGDPANEYFSDGISEEFISSLSRLPNLKVVGRTSSFQFKGKTDDSKRIGEKLGVYYLLEGSVRKSADRVRIAVALIKSNDGANVWSDSYDRELKDIFAMQSEIGIAVAKELKVALLGSNGQTAPATTAATTPNQNVESYNAFLQGNFYSNRRTVEDTRKAFGYYEAAIRLDPRYALAYAKLSREALNLGNAYGGIGAKEREDLTAKARASAKQALELDSNLAEAHLAQSTILKRLDLNFTAAEAELRRALELAPQNAAVTLGLAQLLSNLGRFDEAIPIAQRAIALDPLRTVSYSRLAQNFVSLGRYDEAEAAVREAIALQPQSVDNYLLLASIQILRGKAAAAVDLAKQVTAGSWRTYVLALAYFANGNRAEADAALKKLIDEDADGGGFQIASVYALRKEPDKMFEWLEHAWTTHDPGVTDVLSDPFLSAYKGDPRFIAFAQKVGVMPKAAAKP